MTKSSNRNWSEQEFGRAELGDVRRRHRLVRVAGLAAGRPAGTVTGVTARSADREGAYRLLENGGFAPSAIGEAAAHAAARRCAVHAKVYVALDGSSLNLRDPGRRRGLGPVGARKVGGQGVLVMTGLALDAQGTSLGVLHQEYWTRSQTPPRRPTCKRGSKHNHRPREKRESYAWVRATRHATEVLAKEAPGTRAHFLKDRGADCMSVLMEAADTGTLMTVRAVHDRCLRWPNGREGRLLPSLLRQPVLGRYQVEVPLRPKQVARTAHMDLRVARMPLLLRLSQTKRRILVTTVILATERRPPRGQTPLRWMLFTTADVESVADAVEVVAGYSLRWRIEDFFKTWKTGACNVETSKLETKDAILRWVTIMASVAARIESLRRASRETPSAPASEFYSRDEIDATILLYKDGLTKIRVPYELGDTPTVAEITHWIASLGGHMGNPKTRPPGATVIHRGLEYITGGASVLAAQRGRRSD